MSFRTPLYTLAAIALLATSGADALAQEPGTGTPGGPPSSTPPSTTSETTPAPPPPAPPAPPAEPAPAPAPAGPAPAPPMPGPSFPLGPPPPPAMIVNVDPVDGGVFQVARIAPFVLGGSERWRVRTSVIVKNTGAAPLQLTKLRLSYPGGKVGGLTVLPNDTDPDPDVDTRTVAPGDTRTFSVEDGMASKPGPGSGTQRSLFMPVAPNVKLRLYFKGYAPSLDFTAPMVAYKNHTPEGSYPFPARQADLNAGEYWDANIHGFTREQKFGYDFHVSRWNGTRWTTKRENAKKPYKNTDYLIYGKPVYAIADGTIRNCFRSAPDNDPPEEGPTQNQFYIDHGNGEIALYAHFQAGSVSKTLCPADQKKGTWGGTTKVKAGDLLGNVGNSGSSNGPHLHLHVQLAANGKTIPFTGRPLLFRGSRNVGGLNSTKIGAEPFKINPMTGQMPAAPFSLIAP